MTHVQRGRWHEVCGMLVFRNLLCMCAVLVCQNASALGMARCFAEDGLHVSRVGS
jgi:hypothetical protein